MKKICKKCNIEKKLEEFYKNNTYKDGLTSSCMECIKEQNREYNKNNKDKRREYLKKNSEHVKKMKSNWRENHIASDEEILKKKQYYQNNSEILKEKARQRRLNNIEEHRNRDAEKRSKPEYIVYRREYCKKYRTDKPHIYAWRILLRNTLKRLGKKKEGHTIDLLGYSALDLKNHIESLFTTGMSWDNYGEWHIDHIKLVSQFTKNTHPSVINKLSNLRPLWATTREIDGIIYEGNLNRKITKTQ